MKILLHLIFGLTIGSLFAAPVSLANIQVRKDGKQFPSLFQVWNGFLDKSKDTTFNRLYEKHYITENDLFMTGPWYYGLEFDSPSGYPGEGTILKPESIVRGLAVRDSLLRLNPNIILIGEVRYYDAQVGAAPIGFLPDTSRFWIKQDGKPKPNPDCCPGYALLNWQDSAYQAQVATRAKAILASGVVDGIFLDWATDERIELFKKVRDAIGPDGIIYGNSNTSYREILTPLMNGIFMEALDANSPQEWEAIRNVVNKSQQFLREPKLITLETWGSAAESTTTNELKKMRATMTLMMTQSDGYAIYYPNTSTYFDHWHPWYDFYEINVGSPLSVGTAHGDGYWRREFKNGTAIYNPSLNGKTVTVTFPGTMVRKSTGDKGTTFTVPSYDGDIFIPEAKFQTVALKRKHTIFGLPTPIQYPTGVLTEFHKKHSQEIAGKIVWSDYPIQSLKLFSIDGVELILSSRNALKNLKPGIYIVRMTTKNQIQSKKIVVQ